MFQQTNGKDQESVPPASPSSGTDSHRDRLQGKVSLIMEPEQLRDEGEKMP
jgi:hypothetical protein